MSNVLLISYDNESHLPLFPMNIFYLMGALKRKKHNVGIWFQDVHHQEDEFINTLLGTQYWDVVGIGFVAGYYPYRKVKALAKIINAHEERKNLSFVLGGHGPAGAPEFFLKKMGADAVVVGDGEKEICDIAENGVSTDIIYADNETSDHPSLSCYEFFPLDVYRLNRIAKATRTDFCLPILSSRGCKWSCSFCFRMREGFHERSITAIMEEIRYLHKHYRINYFDFEDELLMASRKRTEKICEAILSLPFKMKWACNGRLNFANPKILKLMKSAGCEYVNYGIESLNQKILNQMGKGLTLDAISSGVKNTMNAGLSPGLNLLWGFPDNTYEDLRAQVSFLLKYDPCDELRTIRPVTAYPGCRLFNQAIEKGLVKDAEDFYENKHTNSDLISINFMDADVRGAHVSLFEANKELIENYYRTNARKMTSAFKNMYFKGAPFRGARAV